MGLNRRELRGRSSDKPLYRQIAALVQRQIRQGALAPGSRLPTIRSLAEELGVTRVTVQRAYEWLGRGGWTEATVGRGTFVCLHLPHQRPPTSSSPPSPAEVLLGMQWAAYRSGMTSLALAEGDSAFAPTAELQRIIERLAGHSEELLGYNLSQGDYFFRQQVTHLLRQRSIEAVADDLVITTGVTGALSLVTDYFCQPGDAVIVEDPGYVGALALFESRRLRVLGLRTTSEGPDPSSLSALLKRERPKFVYTMPTFQNPTGGSITPRRRRELLRICRKHELLIVEDDTFGLLPLEGPAPPPLFADPEAASVVYVGGLSKVLLPGLRLGWLFPPKELRKGLFEYHRVGTLSGPPLLERAAAHFLEEGHLQAHLNRVLPVYRRRRDATLDALTQLGAGFRWTVPNGGFCCWVSSRLNYSELELQRRALEKGIAVAPGSVFRASPPDGLEFRICYASLSRRRLRRAVGCLGKILRGMRETETPPRHADRGSCWV